MTSIFYVINPSSRTDTGITEDLALSLAWAGAAGRPQIVCVTLDDGPNGIANARDSDDAAPAVLRFIEREAGLDEVAGFVVACFSDPGVHAARELTSKPVIGIGEAGYLAALALADLVGTIGVGTGRGEKGRRLLRQMGVSGRLAGHRGLGLDYGELQDPQIVTERLVAAGLSLRDEDGAGALLFAGAGLARYVAPLAKATGLPVLDPTQAAGGLLLALTCSRSMAALMPGFNGPT
jgi:Asp/Glu/hydantoin racemase